jgi:hypothetical protein
MPALARHVLHEAQRSNIPPQWEHHMAIRKKLALFLLAALVLAGAYDALHNLPVLSGCNFYSECPTDGAKRASD